VNGTGTERREPRNREGPQRWNPAIGQ